MLPQLHQGRLLPDAQLYPRTHNVSKQDLHQSSLLQLRETAIDCVCWLLFFFNCNCKPCALSENAYLCPSAFYFFNCISRYIASLCNNLMHDFIKYCITKPCNGLASHPRCLLPSLPSCLKYAPGPPVYSLHRISSIKKIDGWIYVMLNLNKTSTCKDSTRNLTLQI